MPVPEVMRQIAADVATGKVRRAKVRTLLGYYGLKRRREAGISAVRADLHALGLETDPDFATAGYDEQVRFVPRGSKESGATEPSEGDQPRDYALEPEAGSAGLPRFRVLLRTYDAFERLQSHLIGERLANVLQAGQNARREDRDRFPFFLSVELRNGGAEDELTEWVCGAVSLAAPDEERDPEPAAPAVELAVEWDGGGVMEHATALHEDLRASLAQGMSELEQRLNRKVDEIRFEAVRTLAKELNSEEALKFVQEFQSEMLEKLQAKDAEVTDYVREIGLLEERLLEAEEQAIQQDYDPSDAYPTMAYTVQLFRDLCHGAPVLVHDNALRASARSGSVRRREVLQFLFALKELAEALYRRGGIGQPLSEWFAERGYEYAAGDSQSTSARFGKERTVQLDGAAVQLEEHVTLFPNTSNCVSVYFLRDNVEKRLVVGYVGPHLRTQTRG